MKAMSRPVIRLMAVLATVAASVLLWPGAAHAAATTLDVNGQFIFYTAATGQNDHIVIMPSSSLPETYVFDEVAGNLITSSDPACSYPVAGDPTIMQCSAPGVLAIVVSVFDGGDAVLNWTNRNAYLYGGDGDDALWLGGTVGGAGYANGGAGNDFIASGPGDDYMDGSSGSDTVAYTDSVEPVNASLLTNTGGRSYDTDTFAGMENLLGGGGDDILFGNHSANTIAGGTRKICGLRGGACIYVSGNDQIYLNGGDDHGYGDGGNDFIAGNAGNDELWGDYGNDSLAGDAGNDVLHGEPSGGTGTNTLNGGPDYDLCYGGTKIACENP
jgi:Ca2+-binding RTX toxin-like protein